MAEVYTVYGLQDLSGNMVYVGITGNVGQRRSAHNVRYPFLRFCVLETVIGAKQARIRENTLIISYDSPLNVRGHKSR